MTLDGPAAVAGAVGSLALSAGAWIVTLTQALPTGGSDGATALAAFAASALSAVAAAFLWLVRLLATGTLLHRDPATSIRSTTEAIEANTKAMTEVVAALDRSSEREAALTRMLLARGFDAG